jgi:predicted subunit of tRNA(5-methylaminomethyl-2-thiouridylate) methyltransferase
MNYFTSVYGYDARLVVGTFGVQDNKILLIWQAVRFGFPFQNVLLYLTDLLLSWVV